MKYLFLLILTTGFLQATPQSIPLVNKAWIEAVRNNKQNDTLYVINFWATWCKPCVEELPGFEKINAAYAGTKVKVILVSNDMKKELTGRLPKFINDKKIQAQVVFMNETNPNDWIELVNKTWSGAIPATWFVRGASAKEYFHEGELTYDELKNVISTFK